MIETQFAMNCNEGCNDSALEVAPPRHPAARLTPPLDQRTIRSDHLSGSFVDQTSCDSARVGWRGLFSEVMGAAASCGRTSRPSSTPSSAVAPGA
jgi:hypothetical protein